MNNQELAKKLILEECEKYYNKGGCYTKCRCRNGSKCAGADKENNWNEELIEVLEK